MSDEFDYKWCHYDAMGSTERAQEIREEKAEGAIKGSIRYLESVYGDKWEQKLKEIVYDYKQTGDI
jgi:hypothetical protein